MKNKQQADKNFEKNNSENSSDEVLEDIDYEIDEEIVEESGIKGKLKKLREELKAEKKQSQEYLTGWQTERASFANFKTVEESKRKERLDTMKTNLVTDFLPVLDSFDMAFSNREAWESVDPAWRVGVEYIHTQFMNVLENYSVQKIDTLGVEFNPLQHEPIETIPTEIAEQDHTIATIVQKGYQSGNIIIRPAKVKVYKYEQPTE